MSLCMGAVAFADDVQGNSEDPMTAVNLDVTFTPADGLTTPAYTFNYTVAPGEGVADNNPKIYAGIGATKTYTAAFAAGDTAKTVSIDLSAYSFAGKPAGIYRYVVTQAAIDSEAAQLGILNEQHNALAEQRYMDLYVNDQGKVVAAVLAEDGAQLNGTLYGEENDLQKDGSFSNHFGDTDTPDDPNTDEPEDKTRAHTIELSKVLDGAMADASEDFNFEVTVTYDVPGSTMDVSGATFSIKKNGAQVDSANIGGTAKVALKGGEQAVVTVPNNMTVKVRETTNANEGYKITSTATGFNGDYTKVTDAASDANGTSGLVKGEGVGNGEGTISGDVTMQYTNSRDKISPTGIAMRYAPFLLILIAGIAVLVVSRRRKAELDA
jgi:hypothetical protein